jgi:hypothetical protein
MGGEPLLRPEFIHKVVYYAAKKGFWVYIATNGRLLRPDVADRLGDAGVAVFNFALDSWDLQPSLPKAFVPAEKNLEHILRKQYVDGYLVFFNINICRNNLDDVRKLTEYAHDHRIATDYHINETPMLEQDDHFKHLYDNPSYIRPEDWREIDSLVDWLVEKNKAGYQMVNSVPRLQEIKAFVRMSSGLDLREYGWNGDGSNGKRTPSRTARLDAWDRRGAKRRIAFCGVELSGWSEQRHHPHGRHRRSMLPDVRSHLRLGKHRRT